MVLFRSQPPAPSPALVVEDGFCRLKLGGLTIEWAECFENPIGAELWRPDLFRTLTAITYRYGAQAFTIHAGYLFDGASIPWFVRWAPGFAKHDWHLLAALIHDFICDHPEILPRPVGDGIFVSVMLAIATATRAASPHGLVRREIQAWAMYAAVASFTLYRALAGAEIQKL